MADPQRAFTASGSGVSTSGRAIAEGGTVTTLVGANARPNFGFSFYGPGAPINPVVDGMPIRQWDFAPAVNTVQTPRHTEPFSFAHLRAFANVELVRLAIETRKDQLENLDWMIKPRDNKAARAKERDPRSLAIEKFLKKPDGVTPFASFMRAVDEDLLALDAPALECVRTRGGQLLGLEWVDGATINVLIDDTGRRPRQPKDLAFQQVVRGVVWANLANKDLLYLPRNLRTNHIYGFGPVEQIIVTINTVLRRQGSQLAYFTEGNIPAGLLTAPEGWTNEQIRDLQEWFDQKLAGNLGEQRKLIWGPNGSQYQAFKAAPIKDEFDEWLARLVTFAFSLPPTAFVRQMNKGTAGEDQDRAIEEGLEPLKLWRKRWIDELIAAEFGGEDLEFVWKEDVDTDPAKQAEMDDRCLKNMSSTIDEVRDRRGEDPLPDGLGAKPYFYATDGAVPIDKLADLVAQKLAPPPPPAVHVGPDGKPIKAVPGAVPPAPGAKGGKPPAPAKAGAKGGATPPAPGSKKKSSAGTVAKAAKVPPADAFALSVDRPKALRRTKALAKRLKPIIKKAGKSVASQVKSELGKAADPANEAGKIVKTLDLSALLALEEPLFEEMSELVGDTVAVSLASIGVELASDIVDRVNENAVAYARDRAAELVSVDGDESLIESTREMIRQVIADGLENNIGRDEIASAIQESQAFSEYRSDLIANTEIANANSAAKLEAWDEVRADGAAMVKQWFVSGENGVCDECQANEDQDEIAFDEPFESGDDMEPAHPGCRCVTVARVLTADEADGEGDAEGTEEQES
jgi:hypothetical protein